MRPATISNLEDRTTEDARTGAMRSVQAADLSLPEAALARAVVARVPGAPGAHLLALSHTRDAGSDPRALLRDRALDRAAGTAPLRLLTFAAPEYELEPDHGIVRWRIARGLLVARQRPRRRRLPADRRAPHRRGRGPGVRAAARRGRGRQLLPRDRLGLRAARLQRDPGAHPRAHHARLPALARAAGPGRSQIGGSAAGRTARSKSAGPLSRSERPHRAQLRAVVRGADPTNGAGARAHHQRLGRRTAGARDSARPGARRRR